LNIAEYLARAARRHPERPALTVGTTTVASYQEFERRAAGLARALVEQAGLAPGDRVALAMANSPEYAIVLFAAWRAGLVAVPINAKLHPREFAYILSHSGTRWCVATPKLHDALRGEAGAIDTLERLISTEDAGFTDMLTADPLPVAAVAPDDPAWLFYTSGTTGRPKGAVLTHRNMAMMTLSYLADLDRVDPTDCIVHAAPMSHGSGIYCLPHVARAANQVIPDSGGFDPAEIVDLIAAHRGVTFFFAPTMIVRLMNSPAAAAADFTNLKSIIYGGGPMYASDTVRALELFGPKLIQIYGQGESPMTITYLSRETHMDTAHPDYMARLGSVGVERTDTLVRVVDEDDTILPPGEVGEIVVRGDVVMKGYWRNEEATASTLRNGWLHTGDMGAFDGAGFLTLKDRAKDVIISGGSNIYPREVEEVLLHHPQVAEVSVIGRAHPEWGEVVVAVVVPREGERIDEVDLEALCLEQIARFKRPKAYVFMEALPKNNYGKVLKTVLREQLATNSRKGTGGR